MKCSVIQDLLPSYVDNICSEDSKELVREHVAGCSSCKAKLEQMKNTELVAENVAEKQIDYLKKLRTKFTLKEWLGSLVLVILAVRGRGRAAGLWADSFGGFQHSALLQRMSCGELSLFRRQEVRCGGDRDIRYIVCFCTVNQ